MLQHHLHQVVAFPETLVPQDGFLAGIVANGDLGESVFIETPAGEGAGGLLDVVLAVMADAHAEELH